MEGIVSKVNNRQVNTQNGPATSYSIQIGSDWYSAGFKAPTCVAGDKVDFEFKMNGQYKNLIPNTLRVTGKGEVPAQTTAPAKAKGEFRTPDQLMRTTSVEFAIANATEQGTVEDITLVADEIFDYIKNGKTVVAANRMDEGDPEPF